MHCELNSTLCEAVIAAAALAFFAAQPCSAATVRQTASKQSFEFTQRISPLTNTTVCHELYINETTAPRATLLESIAVVCPGACPWSTVTAQKGWSRFQPTTDMLNCTTPPECGGKIAANASKAMFTCPEVANLRGSCIQSPSNGCKYLGVFLRYGVSWGNDAWPQYDEISCAGPENGTCTWYSDPECTQIIAPGRPPVTGGGIRCVPLPTPDSNGHNQYDDWCGEAIDQLISQAPLKFCREPTTTTTTKLHPWFTCPTPTATPECPLPVPQIATTYSDWECEPTCSYKKPFLRIRQVVKDGIKPSLQCQGPNNSSCTFYADAACSIPLPDQPKPMNNTGASCNESSWDWWCSAVRNYNNPVSASFPYKRRCEYTKYTCIESCDDGTKRNIAVWVDPDGQISCLWNRTWGTCLEFPDGECYDESGKAYEDEEQSRPCPEMGMKGWPGSDWCSHAEDVLRRNGARTCTVETPVIQTVMGTSVSNAEALGVLWAGRAAFIISIALFNML